MAETNNKYSLHNTSNRNGQHLTEFIIENRLECLNKNYQKMEGKLWTYTYANNAKAQIDYVLINKKWKNSAKNFEVYSSFEGVSTDHRIVTAKIRLSLRKNDKRTATTKHYAWVLLNNRDIRDKYVLELRNRYETIQERTEKKYTKRRIWKFRQWAPRGSSEMHSNKTCNIWFSKFPPFHQSFHHNFVIFQNGLLKISSVFILIKMLQ